MKRQSQQEKQGKLGNLEKVMEPGFSFTSTDEGSGSRARCGLLETPHGTVRTPAFVFCATRASIKAVETHQLKGLGVQIILGNTYHLMLRPGAEIIAGAGGLHSFMGWDGPMLSDSGGYQIFAMGFGSVSEEVKRRRQGKAARQSLVALDESGAWFRSYVEGSRVFLSPERAMSIQRDLGVDLVVQLDECTPYHVSEQYTELAMERSLRWAERSLARHDEQNANPQYSKRPQACYGVLQGGIYPHLRARSADALIGMHSGKGFFSLAIGGSLGKDLQEMHRVIKMSMDAIDGSSAAQGREGTLPVHLLGIGDRQSIFYGVRLGIATFDCVAPTRLARHGHALMPYALASKGVLNLHNAAFRNDHRPLDTENTAYSGSTLYTRAYVHHLLKVNELAALSILTQHNIAQMTRMMSDIRTAIPRGEVALSEREQFWCGN